MSEESNNPTTSAAILREEDARLVEAMATGDREALAALYDRYSPLLMALGMRILRERRAVEDLLHDVFLEAWRVASSYDSSRGAVRTWLTIRMRSRALDRLNAAGRRRRVFNRDDDKRVGEDMPAPDDPSLSPDQSAVRNAVSQLSSERREILELSYFEGMSCAEIADIIGIPLGTVKSRMAAGLRQLREEMKAFSEGGVS